MRPFLTAASAGCCRVAHFWNWPNYPHLLLTNWHNRSYRLEWSDAERFRPEPSTVGRPTAPLPSLFSRRYRGRISSPFPIGCRGVRQNDILSTRRIVTVHLRVPEQLKNWIDYQHQTENVVRNFYSLLVPVLERLTCGVLELRGGDYEHHRTLRDGDERYHRRA